MAYSPLHRPGITAFSAVDAGVHLLLEVTIMRVAAAWQEQGCGGAATGAAWRAGWHRGELKSIKEQAEVS